MHAISTNQIIDILHFNDKVFKKHPRALIPTTEKVIKPRPYRIWHQKTESYF